MQPIRGKCLGFGLILPTSTWTAVARFSNTVCKPGPTATSGKYISWHFPLQILRRGRKARHVAKGPVKPRRNLCVFATWQNFIWVNFKAVHGELLCVLYQWSPRFSVTFWWTVVMTILHKWVVFSNLVLPFVFRTVHSDGFSLSFRARET